MNRFLSFASLLVTLAIMGCASAPPPTTGMWETLIDGPDGLKNWSSIGGGNWRVQDDAIVADDKFSNDDAFLISHNSYKDFQIHAEFWVTSNTNSGIYMRCADARPISDRTCYEANIFDRRPDPTYGTGAIVHFSKVIPMPKAANKWNTYDITVKGNHITVMLNGVKTAEAEDSRLPSGPVALQFASGVVKFRKFQIRAL
jgi:3-keto-disaccharide hydrolase